MADTTNMVFSESTNKTGMYEWFQDLCQVNSTSYTAYKYARDANNALLDYFMIAYESDGTWQISDTNKTGESVKTTNIVSGTGAYSSKVDDETSANQILEIERVEICPDNSASASKFKILEQYDEMTTDESIIAKRTQSGVPTHYYIKEGQVYLFPVPDYNCTGGLKIFVKTTPTYYVGTDTTKVAGIPHPHQKYLVLKPAYEYCVVNLPQRAGGIANLLQECRTEIVNYFARRNKDIRKTATMKPISFR